MVGTSIEFDAVLDLCRHEHRRIVLAVLEDRQRSVTVDDLAKAVVERDYHAPSTEVGDETVTRIETTLHHLHLPKLDGAGVVEYDPERRLAEPTAQFDRIEPHFSAIIDADPALAAPLGE